MLRRGGDVDTAAVAADGLAGDGTADVPRGLDGPAEVDATAEVEAAQETDAAP